MYIVKKVLFLLIFIFIFSGCSSYKDEIKCEDVKNEEISHFIVVDIVGEVKNPGIYKVKEGTRLYEAIDKAGGMTNNSYTRDINLARVLKDAEHIVIPNIKETQLDTRININKATSKQLQLIRGIGESKARDIINYRETNGRFNNFNDLKKIAGIKDAFINKIKDYIKFD